MSINKQLFFSFLLLFLVILLFEYTNLDLTIQDQLYNFEQQTWLVHKDDAVLRYFFYIIPKNLLIAYGAALVLLLIFQPKFPKLHRKEILFLLLCVILVPSIIASLKQITNMHCPDAILRYNGSKPFVKLLESFPLEYFDRPGKCYPAGHSTVGFSLISIAFIVERKKFTPVLSVILLFGWTMGLYQIVKGSHYLSETIVTMIAAYIITICLYSITLSRK